MVSNNKKTRDHYDVLHMGTQKKFMSLYLMVAVIGLSIFGIAGIWGGAYVWYHIPVELKMMISVFILLISQIGVGVAMFQGRQGTMLGEGVVSVHCIIVFVAVSLLEQTFYTGGNASFYILACTLLILPSAYFLRSVVGVIWYAAAVLFWAAMVGKYSFMWLFLAFIGPFYLLLLQEKDEVRLTIFSWVCAIGIFTAFAVSARYAVYVPFLMLAALAGTVLLLGYSVDVRKSWGVPFRVLGCLAAAGALLVSCMSAAWKSIIGLTAFPWNTVFIIGMLLAAMAVLYVKGLKKRFWTPTLYALIPFLIAVETVLTCNGFYFSIPVVLSSVYLLFLGFFEIIQGVRFGKAYHLCCGLVIFFGSIIALLYGSDVSLVVLVAAVLVVCFAAWRFRSYSQDKRTAMFREVRQRRSSKRDTTVSSVRSETPGRRRNSALSADNDDAAPVQHNPMPAWMEEHLERRSDSTDTAVHRSQTVVPKQTVESAFVPPVFHEPAQMTLPEQHRVNEHVAERNGNVKEQNNERGTAAKRITSSPWASMPQQTKRKKQFTRSPWSQEGESKE